MSSYQRRRMTARSCAVFFAHAGSAAAAASIARRVSAAPILGTVPMRCPVAGFITSRVAPLCASAHSPARNACMRSSFVSFNDSVWSGSLSACMALALGAGHVLGEEPERALTRELGARCIVGAARIAVEAVIRRVEIELALRVRGLDLFNVA